MKKTISNFFIPSNSNGYYPYSLRKSALVVYTLVLLLSNIFFGTFNSIGLSQVAASSITAGTLIGYTNQERQNSGLGTLATNSKLTAAAHAKANDMISKDYWAHFGPNGESPWQFITAAGYSYIHAGENLAKGFSTSEGVHQAWMASPTHRANIVNGNYKEIGIAVVQGELLGEQTILVVQMFGTSATTPATPVAPTPVTTTPVPKPTQQPTSQTGEIKSISITSPEEGATISTNQLNIDGEVSVVGSVQGSYTVEIAEGEVKLASNSSQSIQWTVPNITNLSDGQHQLEAQTTAKSGTIVKDTVTLTIDTTAPVIDRDFLTTIYDPNAEAWLVKGLFTEENITSGVKIGENIHAMSLNEDGFMQAIIPEEEIINAESVILVVSDNEGNSVEAEILDTFVKPVQKIQEAVDEENSVVAAASTGIEIINSKSALNIGFIIFIATLLAIQVYYYKKLGMLQHKGGHLFTLGVWVFILLALTAVGSVGDLV